MEPPNIEHSIVPGSKDDQSPAKSQPVPLHSVINSLCIQINTQPPDCFLEILFTLLFLSLIICHTFSIIISEIIGIEVIIDISGTMVCHPLCSSAVASYYKWLVTKLICKKQANKSSF